MYGRWSNQDWAYSIHEFTEGLGQLSLTCFSQGMGKAGWRMEREHANEFKQQFASMETSCLSKCRHVYSSCRFFHVEYS